MRNPFKIFSFQATFFTSFILISALLIMLLGITSYYITNQEVVEQTISSRKLLLNEINKQLDIQLQSVEYDSLVLSSNPKLIHYLQLGEHSFERIGQNADIVDMLTRPGYIKEGIHSVQLYAKDTAVNKQIAGSGVFDYRIVETSTWFNEIKDADYAWIGTHPIEVGSYTADERLVISFARKVLSPSGKELGILVINLKLPFIEKIVSGSGSGVSRFVLDTHHRLIAEFNGAPKKSVSYESHKDKLDTVLTQSESEQYAIADLEKKELVIWNKQDRTLWLTLDVIPWDNITQGSRRIETVIVVAAFLCILFAIVMAFLLSKQFAAPIRKLIHAMNLMKIGKLDVQIDNDYQNEFGHLNDNFNQMTGRIDHLLVQVEDQHRRKREAEIQVLQEQINPHFLYNTLDMMNWHAIESGNKEISHMLVLLGKMLRIGLSSGASFIPVKRELEHLHCYVELQKIRHKQTIQFHIDVPETMYGYYTPKLIIQPFVENALIHGLHSREEGIVTIAGWEDERSLYFAVEDNGVGMEAEGEPTGREHSGMRNVRERIELYFGNSYGVRIDSRPNQGTTIVVSLPKISEPPGSYGGNEHDKSGHH
ncbi:sensor histidine kinase [Paenibacillus sp. NPDC056579]|uniref:sensor histidine kinase n=1 Tax=Paenibacillus sp. NPDC056579 TaxID=3345871 RepID=UPI003678A7C1